MALIISMLMLHAAKFANGQPLASRLERLVAGIFPFARGTALRSRLVGGGHGAVFGDVLPGFLVSFSCYGNSSCLRNEDEG